MVTYPSFADSQPFRYIAYVEQALGFDMKGGRFQDFEGWGSGWFGWSWQSSHGRNLPCGTANSTVGCIFGCVLSRESHRPRVDSGAGPWVVFKAERDSSQMCSVTNTQFQHGEPLGDYERLDVNDLSVRNNLAIEGAGMSPPKMRSAKRML